VDPASWEGTSELLSAVICDHEFPQDEFSNSTMAVLANFVSAFVLAIIFLGVEVVLYNYRCSSGSK